MRVLPVPQGRMILPRAWPMGMPSRSVSSCPLNLLTAALTASFCMQVLDCLRHWPSGLGWQWGHSSSLMLPCACAVRSAWRLMSLIFLLSWELVRSALSLCRLSPLVTSHLWVYSSFSLSAYEAVYFLPGDVLAAPAFVQLPGLALDGDKVSTGVDGYGVYAVVLVWFPGVASPGQAIPPMSSNREMSHSLM